MLKIKPKSEVAEDKQQNNTEVLREISKYLQLKPTGQQAKEKQIKKRTYYYNYGTSATSSSATSTPTSEQPPHTSNAPHATEPIIPRSISAGSVVQNHNNHASLLDLDFTSTTITSISNKTVPVSMSLNKVAEQTALNNLYNIDEDKEVESSFQYGNQMMGHYTLKKSVTLTSTTTAAASTSNGGTQSPANNTLTQTSSSSSILNGRFTPACFPGRTTPDFRHTTSLFEQQGTRASIVSPLTLNGGSEVIPIAIAFNETIHAYFKMGDPTKFKVDKLIANKIKLELEPRKILFEH